MMAAIVSAESGKVEEKVDEKVDEKEGAKLPATNTEAVIIGCVS